MHWLLPPLLLVLGPYTFWKVLSYRAQSAKRESEIMNILINPNRNKLCQGSQRTFSTCSQGGCSLILYKLRRKLWDIDTPTEMLTEDNDMRLQRNYRLLIRGSYLDSPTVTERFLVALLILKMFGNKKSFILEATQKETIFFHIKCWVEFEASGKLY